MKVLVVAAHPDDEVLGCGGTIARFSSEGADVHLAILCQGALARRSHGGDQAVKELQRSARKAADILGASGVEFFGLPDNELDTLPLLSVVRIVEGLIDRHAPNVVYTHSSSDLNIDHGVVSRAVLTASRPAPGTSVREVLAFQVLSSSEWNFSQVGSCFTPNVFVDISNFAQAKLDALRAYEQELRPFPFPRSLEAIQASAALWGSTAGVRAAEAFQLVRAIR